MDRRHADQQRLGCQRRSIFREVVSRSEYSNIMGARDIKIGTLADAARWTKRALAAAISTPRGSPERRAKLEELIQATTRARFLAEAYKGELAVELRVALRAAEIVLDRIRSDDPAGSPRHQASES